MDSLQRVTVEQLRARLTYLLRSSVLDDRTRARESIAAAMARANVPPAGPARARARSSP